jgi:hypothetical protein
MMMYSFKHLLKAAIKKELSPKLASKAKEYGLQNCWGAVYVLLLIKTSPDQNNRPRALC